MGLITLTPLAAQVTGYPLPERHPPVMPGLIPLSQIWRDLGVAHTTAYRLASQGHLAEFGLRKVGGRFYAVEREWRKHFKAAPPEPDAQAPADA